MKATTISHILVGILILTAFPLSVAGSSSADGQIGTPATRLYQLDLPDPAYTQHLDTLDPEALIAEETALKEAGWPSRIGINRPVFGPVFSDGESIRIDSSHSIWRYCIHSPGALKMRVHFTDFSLKETDRVFVFSPDDRHPESYYYDSQGPDGTGDFWSWATPGDRVIIEWIGTPESDPELPFAISGISHAYRDPIGAFIAGNSREGNCHNDATCDTAYRQQRDASAYIEFNDSGWYICSGTMLSDTSHDLRPFFITANHCISTQPVAATIQVFFYYHTSTCNAGSASVGAARNGSNLRATRSDSDFCLLELTSTNFANVYFAGWDTESVASGEAVTSVHHPDGAYKRISYGSRTSSSSTNMWEVVWNRTSRPGVTEPGSSGGGLFRDSTHRFIGQLYGGGSSCQQQSSPDIYGKFTRSYTNGNLSTWLGNATTCDGVYYATGATPTPSATPAYTPTPARTNTPKPTNSPIPSATPTPVCSTTGCTIEIPSVSFKPGDAFSCRVRICNVTGSTLSGTPVFVILDVLGVLFFAPSFNSFDYFTQDIPPGTTRLSVIDPFIWPTGAGSFSGAVFYAALTDPSMTSIIGEYDAVSFGWDQ